MKKGIQLTLFVVIGAGVIAWGSWYANNVLQTPPMAITTTTTTTATTTAADTSNPQALTPSTAKTMGLQITDLTVGTGAIAQNGDVVTVNYVGTLDNGTVFDSSYSRKQPFSFTLGVAQVIQGWDLGVLGMRVGGKRELVIPSDLGYGASGAGGVIPPNATLHFTIELLSVASSSASSSQ
jgi:peptidylprolyl isomerase